MKTLKYEEVYRTEYRGLEDARALIGEFLGKSITVSACIRRSVIARHWSSSTTCGAPQRWGENEHEFSEAWGIYRSDDVGSTGSKRSGQLPVLLGRDEFQPAIPWQVALQQSLPPLRRPQTILQNQTSPYNDFSANGNSPLNSVSHPQGALHTIESPRSPPALALLTSRSCQCETLLIRINSRRTVPASVREWIR